MALYFCLRVTVSKIDEAVIDKVYYISGSSQENTGVSQIKYAISMGAALRFFFSETNEANQETEKEREREREKE